MDGVRVREPADLAGVAGLILPGGESTTMRQLIDRWGLHEPIMALAERGAPIFGTCAGMIVLAREIAGGEPPILPLLDVTVERNAFGRQLDSFEAELPVPVLGDTRGPRDLHPCAHHRADRSGCGHPGPPRRRAGRRGPRAQHHRHGLPSRNSPGRPGSIDSSRRWPPSMTTRAKAPVAATTRPEGHGRRDDGTR